MKFCSLIIVFLASALFNQSAVASSWYYINVYTDSALYFFDKKTVEKGYGTVTLWVKVVQKNKRDTDGSWATASRWRINCSKRTIQNLAMSTYDSDGKFIGSFQSSDYESSVTPGSTGYGVYKISCAANFPNDRDNKNYFPVDDNDIFSATRRYVESIPVSRDRAPQ